MGYELSNANAYQAGYKARVAGELVKEYADHWSGKKALDKSDDWFTGYDDAGTDIYYTLLGSDQMQFGLEPIS